MILQNGVDLHCHILPGMDDGSSCVSESVEMLKVSFQYGVRTMVATPHFYPTREDPAHFLARRRQAWASLEPSLADDMPKVLLGAEVYYFTGISEVDTIGELCIQDTNVLLLEMPFHRWSTHMLDEVLDMAQQQRYTILLAHIERYLPDQPREVWDMLSAAGVLFQVNANAFLKNRALQRRMLRLLKADKITALATDCHNLSSRRPNLDQAWQVIADKTDVATLQRLNGNAQLLLG